MDTDVVLDEWASETERFLFRTTAGTRMLRLTWRLAHRTWCEEASE
jgi:hypothetical protein